MLMMVAQTIPAQHSPSAPPATLSRSREPKASEICAHQLDTRCDQGSFSARRTSATQSFEAAERVVDLSRYISYVRKTAPWCRVLHFLFSWCSHGDLRLRPQNPTNMVRYKYSLIGLNLTLPFRDPRQLHLRRSILFDTAKSRPNCPTAKTQTDCRCKASSVPKPWSRSSDAKAPTTSGTSSPNIRKTVRPQSQRKSSLTVRTQRRQRRSPLLDGQASRGNSQARRRLQP